MDSLCLPAMTGPRRWLSGLLKSNDCTSFHIKKPVRAPPCPRGLKIYTVPERRSGRANGRSIIPQYLDEYGMSTLDVDTAVVLPDIFLGDNHLCIPVIEKIWAMPDTGDGDLGDFLASNSKEIRQVSKRFKEIEYEAPGEPKATTYNVSAVILDVPNWVAGMVPAFLYRLCKGLTQRHVGKTACEPCWAQLREPDGDGWSMVPPCLDHQCKERKCVFDVSDFFDKDAEEQEWAKEAHIKIRFDEMWRNLRVNIHPGMNWQQYVQFEGPKRSPAKKASDASRVSTTRSTSPLVAADSAPTKSLKSSSIRALQTSEVVLGLSAASKTQSSTLNSEQARRSQDAGPSAPISYSTAPLPIDIFDIRNEIDTDVMGEGSAELLPTASESIGSTRKRRSISRCNYAEDFDPSPDSSDDEDLYDPEYQLSDSSSEESRESENQSEGNKLTVSHLGGRASEVLSRDRRRVDQTGQHLQQSNLPEGSANDPSIAGHVRSSDLLPANLSLSLQGAVPCQPAKKEVRFHSLISLLDDEPGKRSEDERQASTPAEKRNLQNRESPPNFSSKRPLKLPRTGTDVSESQPLHDYLSGLDRDTVLSGPAPLLPLSPPSSSRPHQPPASGAPPPWSGATASLPVALTPPPTALRQTTPAEGPRSIRASDIEAILDKIDRILLEHGLARQLVDGSMQFPRLRQEGPGDTSKGTVDALSHIEFYASCRKAVGELRPLAQQLEVWLQDMAKLPARMQLNVPSCYRQVIQIVNLN